MDVPSTAAGRVAEVSVKKGDRVSKGSLIVVVETAGAAAAAAAAAPGRDDPRRRQPRSAPPAAAPGAAAPLEVRVPDLGDFKDVEVIEVLVKEGDAVALETPLVTLETEKATMDVPSSAAGTIAKLHVSKGSRVNAGDLVATRSRQRRRRRASRGASPRRPRTPNPEADGPDDGCRRDAGRRGRPFADIRSAHASPSVRRFARELGVDLARVTGSGLKGRISEDDVKAFVKQALAGAARGRRGRRAARACRRSTSRRSARSRSKPLGRIQKISGPRLQASWVNIPHVTQHDEADITELEKLRAVAQGAARRARHQADAARVHRARLRAALARVPELQRLARCVGGQNLVFKKYLHIGFAADTPNGLVVPVIRDADRKDIYELARELADARGQGARRQADGGRNAGRLLHDLEPRRHRRHGVHADHQCARGRDPRRVALAAAAGLEGRQVRAAADAAAVAVL